jgi:hypothetical protein
MRSILRGDPADLEALSNFLRANGIVENAAASMASPPLTAEMSLGSQEPPQTAARQVPAAKLKWEKLKRKCLLMFIFFLLNY